MEPLPSGTVSLLFSDMEGSTMLVRELGDAWPGVLDRMRRLCREAWSAHEGHELGTEGDSFFVAFATAPQAVAAAVAAQQALAHEAWPAPVRIRIGVHTGHPQRHTEGYVGLDVHRAARIAASAHGGQVVVSEATMALLDPVRDQVGFRDLGSHRLKDIPERAHLFQLTAPELTEVFPPLRTQGGAGSLPAELTPTVGRDGERAELAELLRTAGNRLVTLTGPGGTGKTRLAVTVARDVADDHPDGVYLVPLETTITAAEIWVGIGRVLDLPAADHAPPRIFDHLAGRRTLLVLDNLEQNPEAADVVRQILEGARGIAVIAASRRALHVEGEHEHAVPPLMLPHQDTLEAVRRSGAGQLFVEHARRARRGFALNDGNASDVAQLVRALDGLPLAIELVAARAKLLTPRALLTRIDQTLDLGTSDRGRPGRQQTLRAAVEWSYELLTPEAQTVLDHLGVFESGATIEAITDVVPLPGHLDVVDILYDLADASLVRVAETDDGEPRVHLLSTVQRFALDRLRARSQHDRAVTAHAQHFYDMFREMPVGGPHGEWLARRAGETANTAAVLERLPQGVTDDHYADGVVPRAHLALLMLRIGGHGLPYVLAAIPRAAADLGNELTPLSAALIDVERAWALNRTGQNECALAVVAHVRQRLDEHGRSPGHEPMPRHFSRDVAQVELTQIMLAIRISGFGDADELEEAMSRLAEIDPRLSELPPAVRAQYHQSRYVHALRAGDVAQARSHLELAAAIDEFNPSHFSNLADLDLQGGHRSAAHHRLVAFFRSRHLALDPYNLIAVAENWAEIVLPAAPAVAARVLGAVDRARLTEGLGRSPYDVEWEEALLATAETLVDPGEWDAAFERGRDEQLTDLIVELTDLPAPPDDT